MITAAFDVDGTLIDFFTGKPRYEIIALFHAFQKRDIKMFIWSGQGIEHAKETAGRLNLQAQCVEKGSFTPDIAVDDEERHNGKINIPA